MKKSVLVLSVIGVITLLSTVAQAIVFPLSDPPQYNIEIGPVKIVENSAIDIYVENVLNENRWKDWKIIIWVPDGEPALTQIRVDYSNDDSHVEELEWFYVTLAPFNDFTPEPGFKGFYANTWLPDWEEFGTNPVGSGLPHAWGNPAWVSFHFEVNADPWIYIKDACIPEPTTICLLGLGALVLRRKA
jgi:hypothetical protein